MSALSFTKTKDKNEYCSSAATATGSSVVLHVEMEKPRGKSGAIVQVQHSTNGTGWVTCARWRVNDEVEEVSVGGLKVGQKVRLVVLGTKPQKMEVLL